MKGGILTADPEKLYEQCQNSTRDKIEINKRDFLEKNYAWPPKMSHTDWPLHYDSKFRHYDTYRDQLDMWLVDYFCYRFHGIECYRGEEIQFLSGCSDKCVHMCLERLGKVDPLSHECSPSGERMNNGRLGFVAEALPGTLEDIRRAFGEWVPAKWTEEYLKLMSNEELRDEMIVYLDEVIQVQGESGGVSLKRKSDKESEQAHKDIADCTQQRIFVCRLECQECIDSHNNQIKSLSQDISQQEQNKMCEKRCASDWYKEYDALVQDGLAFFKAQYPLRV